MPGGVLGVGLDRPDKEVVLLGVETKRVVGRKKKN